MIFRLKLFVVLAINILFFTVFSVEGLATDVATIIDAGVVSHGALTVSFSDTNLEQTVRAVLDKPTGNIIKADMETITVLDLSENGIENLAGIEYAINLQNLNVWNNKIDDISPLEHLTNLTTLSIAANPINSLTPLSGLVSLQELLMGGFEINDLTPLQDLVGLQKLTFVSSNVTDITPLSRLTNLEMLHFENNLVRDISPLSNMTKLWFLDFSMNNVSDIGVLANLTKLQTFSFGNNDISNIDVLANMTDLRWLGFCHNKISDVNVLNGLTNLEYLFFNSNNVTDISPLSNMTRLKELAITNNYLDINEGSYTMNLIQQFVDNGVIVKHVPQMEAGDVDTNLPLIAAGGGHSVAVRDDGTLWTWGGNWWGQLGDGSTEKNPVPSKVGEVNDILSVAAGTSTTLVVKKDGSVWGCGYTNAKNQLTAIEPLSGVKYVAAGGNPVGGHHLAVKNDGTVWAWGDNSCGQLGDGTLEGKTNPVQVDGLSDVKMVSVGHLHSVAVKNDGTVWTWGSNIYGQLGDGTEADKTMPIQVPNLTNVVTVSAGGFHTMALEKNGAVWAWGENSNGILSFGLLGDGSTENSSIPVQVCGLSDIVDVSTAESHTIALKSDGTVWLWGDNSYGQIGNGTWENQILPVKLDGLENIVAVSAGDRHTLALEGNGNLYSWGWNFYGQLGDGNTEGVTLPKQVMQIGGITSIAKGYGHTLALDSDGNVWGWGNNSLGQLGIGTNDGSSIPVKVHGLTDIKEIFAYGRHSMALKNDGTVWGWGDNSDGQLGDGTKTLRKFPAPVLSLNDVKTLETTPTRTVALKNDGTVWGWGSNWGGQLGNGTTEDKSEPVQVEGISDIIKVSASFSHSAALESDGTVWVWGNNCVPGEPPNVSIQSTSVPFKITNLTNIVDIYAEQHFTVALKNDGTVWIWGVKPNIEFGSNLEINITPTEINGLLDITDISVGTGHILALKQDGTLWAWGWNEYGQLGNGTNETGSGPFKIDAFPEYVMIKDIMAFGCNSVALDSNGSMWAWGWNEYGQLGNAKKENQLMPLKITDYNDTKMALVDSFLVALKNDGTVWASGDNSQGQLGGSYVKFPVLSLINFADVPLFYKIQLSASPTAGGIVTGEGIYEHGNVITVIATPNSGYNFDNWTEDGNIVSDSTAYTFAVTGNRILTANFSRVPSPPPSGGVGGGPAAPPPPPQEDQKKAPEPGKTAVVAAGAVAREFITGADGRIVESFMVKKEAAEQIKKAKKEGNSSIEIRIEDPKASAVAVSVPKAVLESIGEMNLVVNTPGVTLELPKELVRTITAAGQGLSMQVESGDAGTVSEQLAGITGAAGAEVLGTPVVVHTAVIGKTNISIPLSEIKMPKAAAERQVFLDALRIFVAHSDGEKQVTAGTIAFDAAGNPLNINFTVNKFSTFALIKLPETTSAAGLLEIKLTIGQLKALINGESHLLDTEPFIKPGVYRTMLPVRFIAEAMGVAVTWAEADRQVIVKDPHNTIVLTIDSARVLVNNSEKLLDCPAEILPPGRTLVPLRFVSENLGAKVDYDGHNKEITIRKNLLQ